jgi:hypothetical protein
MTVARVYVDALKARVLPARAEQVKVAYLSTYPPRECGIATFCEDLIHATRVGLATIGIPALSST